MPDQHVGSEFKAVAKEALQLGTRFAKAGRDWLTSRSEEMKHRDERGDEQRYAQEDARTSGRHHRGASGSHDGDRDRDMPWNDQSPGAGARPGSASRQGSGADWDRSVQDVRAGSGREYGHGDSGRDLGGQSYWRGVNEQDQKPGPRYGRGSGSGPGAGSERSGQGGTHEQYRVQGMPGGGQGRHQQQPGAGAWGGESSGSGGYTQGGRRGVGGYGQPMDSHAREAQEQGRSDYSSAGSGHGGSTMGPGGQAPGRGHRGKGPKQFARSDERIVEDINERLTDDDDIDATDIDVKCESGIVTLEGAVPERWMKHRSEDLVESCGGVKDVENRLQVRRESSDSRNRESQSSRETGASASAQDASPQGGQDRSSTKSTPASGSSGSSQSAH